MPRQRSPDREKAEILFLESSGKLKLKEIADQLNLPEGTIRGWKNKDQWDNKLNGTFRKKMQRNTERSKRKKGAQLGNKNAKGNKGGAAPQKNKNAETHGFFTKFFPEETMEIMLQIETRSPIDMLWDQIMIQYTAIIRAQKIMYVTDKDEMIKELKKQKEYNKDHITKTGTSTNESSTEIEWNFQFSWDRQATFLKAQSRAMAELRNMIKQYEEMVKSGLATEEQKLRIEKLKAEVKNLKGEGLEDNKGAIEDFIKATSMSDDKIIEMFGDAEDEQLED